MFKKKLKFSEGAIKKKLRFAFKPTLIDGGAYKILFKFYYQLYKRTDGYLNWDMPDNFHPIGNFSKKGINDRYDNLKMKNNKVHWIKEDTFKVSFMKTKKDIEKVNLH